MKKSITIAALAFVLGSFQGLCTTEKEKMEPEGKHLEYILVKVACGQCQFDMEGDGCDLAVEIDGKHYFVDGTGIDDHGDAHSPEGFCNAISDAKVTGSLVNGRFLIRGFELIADQND